MADEEETPRQKLIRLRSEKERRNNSAMHKEMAAAELAEKRKQMTHPPGMMPDHVGWEASEMPGWKQFAAGGGKAIMDTGMGLSQLVGATSQEDVDNSIQRDEALMSTPQGVLGNVTGHVGTALTPGTLVKGAATLPALASQSAKLNAAGNALLAPKTVTGGAAFGGTYMGTQPVQMGGSRGKNIAIGAAAAGVVPGLANLIRGGKAFAEPLTKNGRNSIVGRLLREQAGDNADDVAQRMAQASEIIPGSQPTAAEVANSVGIAKLQRTAAAKDPLGTFNERAIDQRIARSSAVKEIAGTPEDLANAQQARKAATAPLYKEVSKSKAIVDPSRTANLIDKIIKNNPSRKKLVSALTEVRESMATHFPVEKRAQEAWTGLNDAIGKRMSAADLSAVKKARTIMSRAKKGTIDADEALEQLKGIKGQSKTASEAIDHATTRMKDAEFVLMESPQSLKSASQNIGDILDKTSGGVKVNKAISRELTTIKKSLDHQINKAEPAYGAAQKAHAEGSVPINQMQIAGELEKKLTPALTANRETANSYATALRSGDQLAASATGFKRATLDGTMTPDQLLVLNNVKSDAARSANVDILGKGTGSDTAEKLSMMNMMDQFSIPRWAQNMPGIKTIRDFGGAGLYGQSDDQIRNQLSRALLNPKEGAALMNSPATQNKLIESLRWLNTGGGMGANPALDHLK